ncbi:hypothetical protein J1N35_008079 [Gossypium stocksii]|uniref:RNase H type-1 domain-containing protein n=1 Tax=Gossypium stocksii TaxID=47602 RepID=A0A9D3W8G0_9ROSI|nr:hypothetical protein J1N35_008079 [Gossypium stocksii]
MLAHCGERDLRFLLEGARRRCFEEERGHQCHIFYCALWVIWAERSKNIHEGKNSSGRGVSETNFRYIQESDATGDKNPTKRCTVSEWRPLENQTVLIKFDVTYNSQQFRSTSSLIARDDSGKVLVSKSSLERKVASSFTAEACACSQAVRLGISMGVDLVEIEGDALTVINKCQTNVVDKLEIGAYIRDIQEYKDIFKASDSSIFQDWRPRQTT